MPGHSNVSVSLFKLANVPDCCFVWKMNRILFAAVLSISILVIHATDTTQNDTFVATKDWQPIKEGKLQENMCYGMIVSFVYMLQA